MSDLRTRIVNTICDNMWRVGRSWTWDDLADAVIAELGLKLDSFPDIAGPDWGTHDRYVTPTVFVPGHLYALEP